MEKSFARPSLNLRRRTFLASLLATTSLAAWPKTGEAASGQIALTPADLERSVSGTVIVKLQKSLKSYLSVIQHSHGLQNVTDAMTTNDRGDFTMKFNDPLKIIPETVQIRSLSPFVFPHNKNFHSMFLTLCALEIACYLGGDKFKDSQEAQHMPFSLPAVVSANISKGLSIASKFKSGSSAELKQIVAELKEGGMTSFKRNGSYTPRPREIESVKRLGAYLEATLNDKSVRIDTNELRTYLEISFGYRDFSEMTIDETEKYSMSITTDTLNAARLGSIVRVFKLLFGSTKVPTMYAFIDPNFQELPVYGFGINSKQFITVPGKYATEVAENRGQSVSFGAISVDKLYTVKKLQENNIKYFSEPYDINSGLIRSLFCAIGVTKLGHDSVEDRKAQKDAEDLGFKFFESESKMIADFDGLTCMKSLTAKDYMERSKKYQRATSR
jgi:hypothetical protein